MQFIFSIYDSGASAYLPPFVLPAAGMAERSFSDCVNDKSHAFSRHPADYTLFQIGTWDEQTAEIAYTTVHKKLVNGLERSENYSPKMEAVK